MGRGCVRKYSGSIAALQNAIARIEIAGSWTERISPLQYTFRSNSGDIVNWWPRTRTLQFQGRASPEFENAVLAALGTSVQQKLNHLQYPTLFQA